MPANITADIRAMTELAVQAQLVAFGPALSGGISVSGDLTKQTHPCVRLKVTDNLAELDPSAGIFSQRLEVNIELRADAQGEAGTTQLVQQVRQAFYRNDLDARPMKSLALQLTAAGVAAGLAYTCLGVVPESEGPVSGDQEDREYIYRLVFEVHAMPRNP